MENNNSAPDEGEHAVDELEGIEDIEGIQEIIADDTAESEEAIVAETIEGPIDAPVYHLMLEYSHDTFYALYQGESLEPGQEVIVPTRYGRDLAVVLSLVSDTSFLPSVRITHIERLATKLDNERVKLNKNNEAQAFNICREKIANHNLEMKLVMVHYLLEEPKVLFFFTAEGRVDFRELVKDLVASFKMRIELRQIGIRDESRITGGVGICGRQYCCHTMAQKLKPVSIRMAKDQNMSLNSMKISGSCGRLLCCLGYEHPFYAEQRKFYPSEGHRLAWDGTTWRVREVNVIVGLVTLDSEDGRQLLLPRSRFMKNENNTWRILDE